MVADVSTAVISPRQPQSETILNRILRISWVAALYLAVILLASKIIVAFAEVSSLASFVMTSGIMLLILASLYFLFLAEGLILVAAQIKPCDKEKACAFINEAFPNRTNLLTTIIETVQEYYDNFIIGRQLIVIFAVVGLTFIIDNINIETPKDPVLSGLNHLYPGAGTMTFKVLNNTVINLFIATLLPCWICQLLPHFLAEERSFQFSQLWFAKTLIDISVRLSNLEAGWPSQLILNSITHRASKRQGLFGVAEEISVGNAAIFKSIAGYEGHNIAERIISIKCSSTETTVEDKSILEFRGGKTTDLTHSVRVCSPGGLQQLIDWAHEFPHDWRPGMSGTPVVNVFETLTMPLTSPGSTSNEAGLLEQVITSKTPLGVPIPRTRIKGEQFGLRVKYTIPALSTDESAEKLYFETGKATRLLVLDIQPAPGIFIRPPELTVQIADELPFLTPPRTLENAFQEQSGGGWKISVPYPPVGRRLFLTLDARKTA